MLRRLSLAALAALWLAFLGGLLGRYAWPLDLLAHFRVQYAVLFTVLIPVLLWTKARAAAVVAAAGALATAGLVLAYTGTGTTAAPTMAGLRIVSLNAWYRNQDFARIGKVLESTRADVVVAQELGEREGRLLQAFLPSYPHTFFAAASGRSGAIIYARHPIRQADVVTLADAGAQGARIRLDYEGHDIAIVGVHLHWPLGGRTSRLRNAELHGLARLARAESGALVIVGDFNITAWSPHFRELLAQSGLNDCAAGRGLLGTWPAQFPPVRIRIDQCLASAHWQVLNVATGPSVGSDHLPMIAEVAFAE